MRYRRQCITKAIILLAATLTPSAWAQSVRLSPPTVSFAPVLVNQGNQSPAKTVTLTNTGTKNLIITNIQATGQFPAGACGFMPIVLPPAGTCQLSIVFNPSVVGKANGTVTIVDNATAATPSPQVVLLSGTGVAPMSASPGSLNFGTAPVGTNSVSKTVTLKNNHFVSLSASGRFNGLIPVGSR